MKRYWILILLLSPFFRSLDLYCSGLFFNDGSFCQNLPLKVVYHLGPLPAVGCAFFSLCLMPFYRPKLQIAIVATLVLGSGLIINAGLKEYWQRPRPKQIKEFAGIYDYREFYRPDFSKPRKPLKSFPSGHASTGFFFLACRPFFRREGLSSKPFLYLGLLLSVALSFTRIAQGGHFLSDIVFSGLIMHLTALVIERMVYGTKHY